MAVLLYVIGKLDIGGTERHLAQVLPILKERGHHAVVFTLAEPGALAPNLVRAGVPVLSPYLASALQHLPNWIRKPLLLPLCVVSFFVVLWRVRPQLLHFYLPQAYLLGGWCGVVAARLGPWFRRGLNARPMRVMSRRSLNHYQKKHPYLARLEHRLHQKMDAVLGNSLAVMGELKAEAVPAERLRLIYNGIHTTELEALQTSNSRELTRQKLGLTHTALVLVCVANLIPYKGHLDLLKALASISDRLPRNWALLLVGCAPSTSDGQAFERELNMQCQSLDIVSHVTFLGQRNDVFSIYAAADIGVLASHEEGFSNSVLEGMAAGAAMVVTNVGGNAEAVLDGQCGWVVPPHNPPALGQALLQLALSSELRQRFAQAAQARVQKQFSLTACVDQYAQLYHDLLGS